MWAIAKRELRFYFSQLTGYLVVGGFLVITTLALWFFDTPYHLLHTELGSFSTFFEFSPLLFLLLIPALSMRTFSEETSQGTLELLLTKPISSAALFGGKLLGVFLIFCVALIPTVLHAYALDNLLQQNNSLDWGVLLSSYLALVFLAILFSVTSVCASLLSTNQITSFLLGIAGCFVHLYLWSFLADLTATSGLYQWINSLGAQTHYNSLSRGVWLLNDLLYFIGLSSAFFFLGVELIHRKRK